VDKHFEKNIWEICIFHGFYDVLWEQFLIVINSDFEITIKVLPCYQALNSDVFRTLTNVFILICTKVMRHNAITSKLHGGHL
jgi:hypothetical protein